MAQERRQDWLDEIARLRLVHPEIKLLPKSMSNADVFHEAPQFEFGPWVVSGAKSDTFVVLRWKDRTKRSVVNPPTRWEPPKGEREAGDWLHRVPDVLGRLDALLAELIAIQDSEYQDGAAKRSIAGASVDVETPPDLDEPSYPEGAWSYRLHAGRERSVDLVRSAKEQRLLAEGRLECEACDFDFLATYGEGGDGFIEAHHTIPISQLGEGARTKAEDLALVCSNCHRMLHRGVSLRTVEELRSMLGKAPRARRERGSAP